MGVIDLAIYLKCRGSILNQMYSFGGKEQTVFSPLCVGWILKKGKMTTFYNLITMIGTLRWSEGC